MKYTYKDIGFILKQEERREILIDLLMSDLSVNQFDCEHIIPQGSNAYNVLYEFLVSKLGNILANEVSLVVLNIELKNCIFPYEQRYALDLLLKDIIQSIELIFEIPVFIGRNSYIDWVYVSDFLPTKSKSYLVEISSCNFPVQIWDDAPSEQRWFDVWNYDAISKIWSNTNYEPINALVDNNDIINGLCVVKWFDLDKIK